MDVRVTDNPAENRYDVFADGELAGSAVYRLRPGRISFIHTEIEDRFEGEGAAFHAALRQAFLEVAKAAPQRCAVIDGSRDPDTVEREIWDTVRARLPDLAAPREQVAHG